MNNELLSKIIKAFLPKAKNIAILKTIKNDDQSAYLISANSGEYGNDAKLVLFENGMSGCYIDEDEAVMELTDGLSIGGWLCVGGGGMLGSRDDVKCRYKLPANYGYSSYFELALIG